jgi:isocitrate lyase
MSTRQQEIDALQKDWDTNPRWKGIKRGYTAADVVRLRGSFQIEHTHWLVVALKNYGTWLTTSRTLTV